MAEQDKDIVVGVGKVSHFPHSSSIAWSLMFPQTTDEAPLSGPKKAAPLPEGLSEVNDRDLSAGASVGPNISGSGKGGHDPKSLGENKGTSIGPGGHGADLKTDLSEEK